MGRAWGGAVIFSDGIARSSMDGGRIVCECGRDRAWKEYLTQESCMTHLTLNEGLRSIGLNTTTMDQARQHLKRTAFRGAI